MPELLGGLLPLAAGAGLEVEWRVLFGSPELRGTATALQSGLRGGESGIEEGAWEEYLDACGQTARSLGGGYDAVVLHDAALGLVAGLRGPRRLAAARGRLASRAGRVARAAGLAERTAGVLVPHESFVPGGNGGAPAALAAGRLHVAPPGIDPLDPRNLELETRLPGRVVRPLGVDLDRPFCLQVLELDRWDDPHAAIDAFRLAKGEEPEPSSCSPPCWTARPTEAGRPPRRSPTTPRTGRRPSPHHLRGPRQPRGRGAAAARPHRHRALAAAGLRARAIRGALEAHACRGWRADRHPRRHRRLPGAGRRPGGRADRELVRDPGLAIEMGRSGASGCASASSSPRRSNASCARSRIAWDPDEGTPSGRHRARARAGRDGRRRGPRHRRGPGPSGARHQGRRGAPRPSTRRSRTARGSRSSRTATRTASG